MFHADFDPSDTNGGTITDIVFVKIVAFGNSAKQVHDQAKKKTSKEVVVFKVPLKEEEFHVLCLL